MTNLRLVCEVVTQTARLMVGVPDYPTYVTHRRTVLQIEYRAPCPLGLLGARS